MADNTKQEKEIEKVAKVESKKEPWTVKRILTTVIIAILALLMVGGIYYIIAMFQQKKDTTNVFGYYNGKPVKLAYNTVFYNTLLGDESYQNAIMSGDYNSLYGSYLTAYQAEVVFQGLSDMANKAGIVTPDKVVDRFIIESGIFAGEDGSTFDPAVYKEAALSTKSATTNYYKMMYPYQVVGKDFGTALVSQDEIDFVKKLSEDSISISYFAVDFNAYPDDLALAYDISEMSLADETAEPTLAQIKSYIAYKEPETVQTYKDQVLATVLSAMEKDGFDAAAAAGNCNVYKIDGAVNNLHKSTFLSGVAELDPYGALSSVTDEALTKELFNAADGYVVGPITLEDGSYVFARVDSANSGTNYGSATEFMFKYYAPQLPFQDASQNVFSSDKFEDMFMQTFFSMLVGNYSAQ